MDKLTIDRKTLFTLASETRIELLKKLDGRRMTLSELSKELCISKAAVKEHTDRLIEAELIRKVDEGKKWIYELTRKGRYVLHPESKTKITLLLSASLASIVGGLFELYRFVLLSSQPTQPPTTPVPIQTPSPLPTTPPAISPTPTQPIPAPATPVIPATIQIKPEIHLLAGLVLILFGIVILIRHFKIKKYV